MEEQEAFITFNQIKTLPQDYKIYDWLQVKYFAPVFFEALPECQLAQEYKEKLSSIRKGYAPTKNFFYDEKGNPIDFSQAEKKGHMKEIDKYLYSQQILFNGN